MKRRDLLYKSDISDAKWMAVDSARIAMVYAECTRGKNV